MTVVHHVHRARSANEEGALAQQHHKCACLMLMGMLRYGVETLVHRHGGECVDWGVARTTSRIALKVDPVAQSSATSAFERLLENFIYANP